MEIIFNVKSVKNISRRSRNHYAPAKQALYLVVYAMFLVTVSRQNVK